MSSARTCCLHADLGQPVQGKAAWGSVNKDGTSCLIISYEAGVVWLPSLITGLDTFTMTSFSQREAGSEKFPLHYDLPLSKYGDKDRPWLIDALR